ncbi:hypothetical protein [uncultured Kordia sp.]|uniref:hypothetical protein n=1 Tax=uncultured Kordia sp. TaxID=507699 RepID=UPI00261EDA70|nr:hypothetical protein [uncultured Kordia sp.]
MEDFDYIDALAKKTLSNHTVQPSADGWQMVQQKMKRKKRKRLLLYIVLFALFCSLGIYVGVHATADVNSVEVSNKNTEPLKSSNSNNENNNSDINNEITSSRSEESSPKSNPDSNSNAIVNDASQAGTNTSVATSETKSKHQATNNLYGNKNNLMQQQTGNHSRALMANTTTATSVNTMAATSESENQLHNSTNLAIADGEEDFYVNAAGLKLAPWELVSPEMLKKKRKKRRKSKKAEKVYDNLDLMVGFNGFVNENDYNFIGSYVFELSYTQKDKLKKKYSFNYGASLQFRNLRFKNDSVSFNRGELSMNIHSGLEKHIGNFGVEAGAYVGYEFYSPNNEFFNNININFFERKINYGLFSAVRYKKVGLVFKYEFSPYVNYLGAKKFGAFTIGVKYDF